MVCNKELHVELRMATRVMWSNVEGGSGGGGGVGVGGWGGGGWGVGGGGWGGGYNAYMIIIFRNKDHGGFPHSNNFSAFQN